MDFYRLLEAGRLCAATGLSHSELAAMDGERVEKLLVINDCRAEWIRAQTDNPSGA